MTLRSAMPRMRCATVDSAMSRRPAMSLLVIRGLVRSTSTMLESVPSSFPFKTGELRKA